MKYLIIISILFNLITCEPEIPFIPDNNNIITICPSDTIDNDGDCCTIGFIPKNCNDNINCTNDFCSNGECFNYLKDCDDGIAGNTDMCNELDGNCYYY